MSVIYCADHDEHYDTDVDVETHRFCHDTSGNLFTEPRSYKPEVIADDSGQWTGNALAFEAPEEAELWVKDLSMRWILVRETRVVPSDEEPNYEVKREADGRLHFRSLS